MHVLYQHKFALSPKYVPSITDGTCGCVTLGCSESTVLFPVSISYETEHLKPRICILVYYGCEQSQLLSISNYSKNRYYSPSSELI